MTRTGQAGLIALIMALALTRPAPAQDSVTDFQLPPAPTPSATPSAQGPVDPDNPFATRPSPRTTATPSAVPTPRPSIALPPVTAPVMTTTPSPEPRATSATPQPQASQRVVPSAVAQPQAPSSEAGTMPSRSDSIAVPADAATPPTREASPVATTQPPVEAASSREWSDLWLLALAGLGLLLAALAGASLLTKQRRARRTQSEDAQESLVPPQPNAPAALAPSGRAVVPPRRTVPAQANAVQGMTLTIEPTNLRVSLAYATLTCRATITNNFQSAIGPIAILGDLATAHRAVDQRAMLAPAIDDLEPLATIDGIEPGTANEQRIEVKLPLNLVAGFRKGGRQFFVPLVRLALVPADGPTQRGIWTVGTAGSARLGPICADTPRLFKDLAAIEIETERWLALDPVRAAS
jgi:hypothetical protein